MFLVNTSFEYGILIIAKPGDEKKCLEKTFLRMKKGLP